MGVKVSLVDVDKGGGRGVVGRDGNAADAVGVNALDEVGVLLGRR